MQSSFLNVIRAAAFGAALVSAGSASAGTLAIQNKGRFPIACTADGWTTGTTGTKVFIAPSGGEIRIDIAPSDTDKDRKSTRLNSSHIQKSRMPSSA